MSLVNGQGTVEALGLGSAFLHVLDELGQGMDACLLGRLPSGLLYQGMLLTVTRAQDAARGKSFPLFHPLVPSRVQRV